MDKDIMKSTLLQAMSGEVDQLAEALARGFEELLENGGPKTFEENFARDVKAFGAKVLGRGLKAVEPEIIEKVRSSGHFMRDANREIIPCTCGGSVDSKGDKDVTWETTLGSVPLLRKTGTCQFCGRWFGFLDEFMEITPQQMTPAMASAVTLVGTCEAFEPSSAILWECFHREFDDNRIRATVLHVAQRAEGWATLSGEDLQRSVYSLPKGYPVTVYLGVDGGRIRMRGDGWKEPCEGVIWWTDPVWGVRQRIAVGDVNDKDAILAALDRWIEEAKEWNPDILFVIIADGAEWIWNWARQHQDAILILDYYHLKENVWKTAKALYGEGHPIAKVWVDEIIAGLWEGRLHDVIEDLYAMRDSCGIQENDAKGKAIQDLVTYLLNHEDLIDYGRLRAADLTIGSGTVESTCKQLFNMRLKGPGMRWSREGAQALIHLRCLYITGRWSELWRPGRYLAKTG